MEYKTDLHIHTKSVVSIIQIKDNRLVSASLDKTIRFWDLKTYKCEKEHTIDDVKCFDNYSLIYVEEKNILIVGGKKFIKIINVNEYQVTLTISKGMENGKYINAICRLLNGNYIFALSDSRGLLLKYNHLFKFEGYVKSPLNSDVNCLCVSQSELGNIFATSDMKGTIITWEY